jgi:hypothetical protein
MRSPMKMMRFIISAEKQSIIWPCAVRTATGTGGSPIEPARTVAAARTGRRRAGSAAAPICLQEAARLVSARAAVAAAEEVDAHDIATGAERARASFAYR